MSLNPGVRLGAYEVVAPLGAGGMGEVYRARDTKLGRDVALKILPDAFASDPERVARFAREARLLASLNHPHIAAIHGIAEEPAEAGPHDRSGPAEAGPHDGAGPHDRSGRALTGVGAGFSRLITALVMEFVDGPTLADRIAQGPIPIDDALPIARQICDALEAAHAQGIIHRDLKPANIKVRDDGTVKVLDFGLAKAMVEDAAAGDPAMSPTMTAATRVGVILGTAAYMAPEQARGKTVDKRADIWAFGVVLYEMLTGRRAFAGDEISDTLAEILKSDPDWAKLPAATPPSIRRLLRRCLEKDRRQRLADIADARLEIDEASREPAGPASVPAAGPRGREQLAWMAAVALLAALVIALGILAGRRIEPEAAEVRMEISTPSSGEVGSLAVSPDGQHIVFAATADGQARLWLRSLSSTVVRPLPGTESGQLPFWSPDSQSIAFFADNRLKRMRVTDGSPVTITEATLGRGGTWLSNGTIVFNAGGTTPLMRVPERGGAAAPLTSLQPPQNGHRFPVALPGHKHIVFFVTGPLPARGIYVVAADGSGMRRLFDADAGAVFAAGHLLYTVRGRMWAVRFDPVRVEVLGEAVPLADNIAFDLVYRAIGLAASGSVVAFRAGERVGDRELVWVDRSGQLLERMPINDIMTPALSPDGRRVALSRQVNQNIDIWILELGRNVFTRLTADEAQDSQPVWSADGQRVIFQSNRAGAFNLYARAAGGSGEDELVMQSADQKTPVDVSPDGRFLLYRLTKAASQYDLLALPLDGAGTPVPAVATQFDERDGQFSPDGKWIAYQANDSGRTEIYARPFGAAGDRIPISTNGGAQVRWRRDGRELFYVALDDRLMAVPIGVRDGGKTLEPGTPVPLFATRIVGGAVQSPTKQQYVVSADGQRFLLNSIHPDAKVPPITVVLNWKPRQK